LTTDPAKYSAAWNFGPKPSDAITVESFVKRTIAEWGDGTYTIDIDENAPHEANLLRLDSTRARTDLNWRTAFDVDEAIRITLAWYRDELLQSESASVLMDSDIKRFEERSNVEMPDD
jgi:CDP-glucose 4,6-dehydratase